MALFSYARGLLGLYVHADGSLALAGGLRPAGPWPPAPQPWVAPPAPLPPGWPAEVAAVEVRQLQVGGVAVRLVCAVEASAAGGAGAQLACSAQREI